MIIEKLNEYYSQLTKRDKRSYFYISQASACERQVYYEMLGYEGAPESAEGMRKMRAGSHSHIRLLSDLHSAGVRVVASEVSVPDNDLIHGRCDCIINDSGEDIVVDFKTSASYGFNLLKDNIKNPEHELQVQLYLHFLKKKWGLLVYECKDTNELHEIAVEYNKALCEQTLEKLKKLKEKIEAKQLPDIPQDIAAWKCNYCRFKEQCLKDGKAVVGRPLTANNYLNIPVSERFANQKTLK